MIFFFVKLSYNIYFIVLYILISSYFFNIYFKFLHVYIYNKMNKFILKNKKFSIRNVIIIIFNNSSLKRYLLKLIILLVIKIWLEIIYVYKSKFFKN